MLPFLLEVDAQITVKIRHSYKNARHTTNISDKDWFVSMGK